MLPIDVNTLTPVTALLIDIVVVAAYTAIAFKLARSILHPITLFLCWHVYVVTLRLAQISIGFQPMAYFKWPVTVPEVLEAGLASDLGLIAFAVGCIVAHKRRHFAPVTPSKTLLSGTRLRVAATVSVVLGLVGLAVAGRSIQSAIDLGDWNSSGYLAVTRLWAPWGMCLLHYLYGFPTALSVLTAVMFLSVMLFNYSRMAIIIPVLFLLFLWLWRRKTTRFPMVVIPAAIALWLIWLPMKPFFNQVGDGIPVQEAFQNSIEQTFHNFGEDYGSGIDFQFLDMTGSTMTLVNMRGHWFWGTTIAPLLYAPVPRTLWPDKPYINQYQLDLDIPNRPMGRIQMTAGVIGEAYANLGWLGICLTCSLLGFAYSAVYRRVRGLSLRSPSVLLYLVLASSMMQVYRDGLVSLFWYPFVYIAPAGWVAVSHWLSPPHSRPRHTTSGRNYSAGQGREVQRPAKQWATAWLARQQRPTLG